MMKEMLCALTALGAGLAAPAAADLVADFEGLAEGFYGQEIVDGGITFFEPWDGFPPEPPPFSTWAIDDSTGAFTDDPDMAEFVNGNLLNINAFSNGPNGYSFALMKRFRITTGQVEDGAALSVAYVVTSIDEDYSNNTVTLSALLDGDIVAQDVITTNNELGMSGGGTFTFGASRLSIDNVMFDELEILVEGPSVFGAILGGIDNVVIPAPPAAAALCLGALAFSRRRR